VQGRARTRLTGTSAGQRAVGRSSRAAGGRPVAALATAVGTAALCGALTLPAAAAPPATSTPTPVTSTVTGAPVDGPTGIPAEVPTSAATQAPPTDAPTISPTEAPELPPTELPPTDLPTSTPTEAPVPAQPVDDAAEVGTPPTAPEPDPAAVAAYEAAVAASADASARLAEVSARAATALQARDEARARHDAAVAEEAHQQELAASAATLVARGRSAVGRWASSAYRGGEDLRSGMPVASALLGSATTDEVGSQLSLLAAVGRQRSGAVREALDAEHVAELALARAAAAEEQAVVEQQRADAESAVADSALAEQRELAAAVDAQLAAAREQLGLAAEPVAAVADLGAAPVDLPAGAGGCASSDLRAYPNGQIPVTALCPLVSAPGHLLRADAARSFDAMSRAYAQAFGTPLCVTDSYRSLAEQISVRARKPTLAAVPGTSRHGLGRAVDLCGGVEDFGTPQHAWVVQRAPMFGWFHPSWADESASKPEPWHFEYAESAGGPDAA